MVRGKVPSLKNDRDLIPYLTADGNPAVKSVPKAKVKKWINGAKSTWRKQLPKGFKILEEDAYAFAVIVTQSPTLNRKADTDNQTTTIQEAFQGVVVPEADDLGDKYIRAMYPIPIVVKQKIQDGGFVVVYFWYTDVGLADVKGVRAEQDSVWDRVVLEFHRDE